MRNMSSFECPGLRCFREEWSHLFQGRQTIQALMWRCDLSDVAKFVNACLSRVTPLFPGGGQHLISLVWLEEMQHDLICKSYFGASPTGTRSVPYKRMSAAMRTGYVRSPAPTSSAPCDRANKSSGEKAKCAPFVESPKVQDRPHAFEARAATEHRPTFRCLSVMTLTQSSSQAL